MLAFNFSHVALLGCGKVYVRDGGDHRPKYSAPRDELPVSGISHSVESAGGRG